MTDYVRARVERLVAATGVVGSAPQRARIPTTGSPGGPLPEPDLEDDDVNDDLDDDLTGDLDDDMEGTKDDPQEPERTPVRVAGSAARGISEAAGPVADQGVGSPWWAVAGGFVRTHALVVGLICLLGVGLAGYTVLRARPVALTVPAQAQVLGTPTPAAPPPGSSSSPSAIPAPGASGSAPSTATTPGAGATVAIAVHVLGAVHHPGVVELPPGSRVVDAIAAAGGLRDDAAPAELNLAQVLIDGEQVLVGTARHPAGEVRTGTGGTGGASGSSTSTGAAGVTAPMDLNAATATQLEELPGVGPVTAASIVAWREQHGRFSRIEELQEIDGIGPKTYARLAPHVRV